MTMTIPAWLFWTLLAIYAVKRYDRIKANIPRIGADLKWLATRISR